jgi:hypothetical protein
MLLMIVYSIASVVIISGVCAAVKLLCKKYINIIDKRQNDKENYYVQANFKN